MRQALAAMRSLTFEFKHPVLVQRAMYGLATAQIEVSDVATAKQTLERLRQSLQHSLKAGGSAEFKNAIDAGFIPASALPLIIARPSLCLPTQTQKKKPRPSKRGGQ